MASCKDCFHFLVCDSGRHIGEYEVDDGVYTEGVESECLTFRNKTDVVEVVRCKDCNLSSKPKSASRYDLYCYNYDVRFCERDKKLVCGKHFCSYGERR